MSNVKSDLGLYSLAVLNPKVRSLVIDIFISTFSRFPEWLAHPSSSQSKYYVWPEVDIKLPEMSQGGAGIQYDSPSPGIPGSLLWLEVQIECDYGMSKSTATL